MATFNTTEDPDIIMEHMTEPIALERRIFANEYDEKIKSLVLENTVLFDNQA